METQVWMYVHMNALSIEGSTGESESFSGEKPDKQQEELLNTKLKCAHQIYLGIANS